MVRLSAFFIVLACASITVATAACYDNCRFNFCTGDSSFRLPVYHDSTFTGAICDKWGKLIVGHIDATGEAYVKTPKSFVPISKWYPYGLKRNFSPSFFKSFILSNMYGAPSGIGHEVAQQNQAKFLSGRCFFLPLKAYQVVDQWGTVVENKHPTEYKRDCVAFSTKY